MCERLLVWAETYQAGIIALSAAVTAAATTILAWLTGTLVGENRRLRKAGVYTRLFAKYTSLGAEMERIGEWVRGKVAVNTPVDQLTEADIRREYRQYLNDLREQGRDPKSDLLENAIRDVKNWFIDCWKSYKQHKDLTLEELRDLITADPNALMWYSFIMTREQTDDWKRLSHDPNSRNSSDEVYFLGLAEAGFRPPANLGSAPHSLQ